MAQPDEPDEEEEEEEPYVEELVPQIVVGPLPPSPPPSLLALGSTPLPGHV